MDQVKELRKLLVLKTIVEEGSFRKAARKLNITPSAVSQSLSTLEKKLGKTMIIRDRQSMKVTNDCFELLEQAEPAFKVLNGLLGSQYEFKMTRLDLGTYESLAMDILPNMVQSLRRDHPGFKLNLVTARTGQLLQKLRSGELCTAFVTETDELDNFQKHVVDEDQLGLYIYKHSPYLKNIEKGIEEIGFSSLNPGNDGYARYYKKFLDAITKKQRPVLTSDSFEVLKEAACQGTVFSILPAKVANRGNGELVNVAPKILGKDYTQGKHKIYLVHLDGCDQREADYLVAMARQFYQRQ